jgi:flagellar basal body-associated protein FliL
MKRCPKCNRTFAEDNQKFCTFDGGLLETSHEPFDPETTIASISSNRGEQFGDKPAGNPSPDLSATAATSSSAFPKKTDPTGVTTLATGRPRPLPPLQYPPLPATAVSEPKKKSKLPLMLGILFLLLVLFVGAVVAAFFLVIKPRLDERRVDTPIASRTESSENVNNNNNNGAVANNDATKTESEFVPPPNTVKFTNSQEKLDGKLAEHYIDFSFYYPNTWASDPKAGVPGASNFVKVEKTREDTKGVYLLENASVSWYNSNGTFDADKTVFPDRVKIVEDQVAQAYPGYEKVSVGETHVNSLKGYEFRFKGTFKNTGQGDLPYWGRVIFVPTGAGGTTGAVISLLATSLASDVTSAQEMGDKGEMSVVLDSFRFGKSR